MKVARILTIAILTLSVTITLYNLGYVPKQSARSMFFTYHSEKAPPVPDPLADTKDSSWLYGVKDQQPVCTIHAPDSIQQKK